MERVAIVSGNSGGFGLALAEHLTGEGWIVPRATRKDLDVTRNIIVESFVTRIINEHGRIDMLVNNAAILSQSWHQTFATNVFGAVKLTETCLPHMKRGSCVINVLGGGATSPYPRYAAYGASKAALGRFSESLALDTAERGIAVLGLLPGPMPTSMLRALKDGMPADELAQHEAGEDSIHRACRLVSYLVDSGLTGKIISSRYDPWPFHDVKSVMASDLYTLRRVDEWTCQRVISNGRK